MANSITADSSDTTLSSNPQQTNVAELGLAEPSNQDSDLTTLKSILMDEEQTVLKQLQEKLAALDNDVGTPEALKNSLNGVLVQSLIDSGESDPKGMSRALSPTVVSSLPHHMKNSVDDIVEVLYPITGRMVIASVRNSIKSLSENINNQIETKYSPRGLSATIRSKITGKPISDYLISQSLMAEIERIMIIEKYSGKIVGVSSILEDGSEVDDKDNMNLVSGLLTSLNNFAEEMFDQTVGGLRTLNLDGRQLSLRRSATHLIVIEKSGVLNSDEEIMVDETFLNALGRLESDDINGALQCLSDLNVRFKESRDRQALGIEAPKSASGGNAITKAVILGLISIAGIWALWQWLHHRDLDKDVAEVELILSEDRHLANFPFEVSPNYSTGEIGISGLVPEQYDVETLRQRLNSTIKERDFTLSYSRISLAN